MTRKVVQMCDVLGVELLDHFIVGKERTLSFSEEVGEFQSENLRYQDKVGNLKNVREDSMDYGDIKEGIKKGDRIKTAISDSTLVLDVRGDNALLFDGRQFVEAYGIQMDQEKVFWNQGHYYDSIPRELFADYRKNSRKIRDTIDYIANNNYEDFVKALITIEKGIEDENILDELYDRFMDNDGVNLINDYFDDVLYDLEHESTVSEVVKIKEKPESILEGLKKNKGKIDYKDLKKEKESDMVSL